MCILEGINKIITFETKAVDRIQAEIDEQNLVLTNITEVTEKTCTPSEKYMFEMINHNIYFLQEFKLCKIRNLEMCKEIKKSIEEKLEKLCAND